MTFYEVGREMNQSREIIGLRRGLLNAIYGEVHLDAIKLRCSCLRGCIIFNVF